MASLCDFYLDPTFVEHDFPPLLSQSPSWEDVHSNLSSSPSVNHFIKEIFINDRHSLKPETVKAEPPAVMEPRLKFQRFREKRLICDECNRSFTMKQNVQQHFFQYHNPNGVKKTFVRLVAKRFQCTKCKKIFRTLEKAQRHETRLHGERLPRNVFVCHHCNKIYNTQNQLKEHIDVVHQNLRPYKCERCGMEFGRAGGLRRHDIMVHQQKKHACPYEGCNHPGYKCTKALAAHIRSVHTLDRPFACLFCEKTFVRKNDLKVHELTHSNRSHFFCSKCNSPFRRLVYLQKHEKGCTGGLKRRRFRRSLSKNSSSSILLSKNSNTVCTSRPDSTYPCDSDETMTMKSNEFDCYEQLLTRDLQSDTEDESVEKLHSTAEKEESGITKNDSLEEGELQESQATPLEYSSPLRKSLNTVSRLCGGNERPTRKSLMANLAYNSTASTPSKKAFLKLPIKSIHKSKEDRTMLETTESELNSNIRGSIMNSSAQANSPTNVKKSDSLEDGEIRELAVLQNDKTPPYVKNLKETPIVMKEEQQSKRMPRRTMSFEPREEAVAPMKTRRSRCLVASVSASSKKQYLRYMEARPAKRS